MSSATFLLQPFGLALVPDRQNRQNARNEPREGSAAGTDDGEVPPRAIQGQYFINNILISFPPLPLGVLCPCVHANQVAYPPIHMNRKIGQTCF